MRPTDQVTHELTGGDGTMPRTRNGQEANIVVNVLSPDGPTPTAPPEFGNAEIHCALLPGLHENDWFCERQDANDF